MPARADNPAPGGPGIEPRWTRAAKDAVGTAATVASQVWYTLSLGILNEVYYPTIDRPQLRDLQFLVTDGETFFHDERRHLGHEIEPLSEHALGFRIVSTDPDGRYRITKEVFGDPDQPVVMLRCRFEPDPKLTGSLRLFVLAAPHLDVGGWDNNGRIHDVGERTLFIGERNGTYLAIGSDAGFRRTSVGYVGINDGWTDLAADMQMGHEYTSAGPGNIAFTGELDLDDGDFGVALAFSDCHHGVVASAFQTLGVHRDALQDRFMSGWEASCEHLVELADQSHDGGELYRRSQALLLAHEDKRYQGAMIASLSIPWGEHRSDDEIGGYHLVWTRDMVNSVTGLMATGEREMPLRSLIYLAATQNPDGGFHQNFWITGEPHWTGIQLDEVAMPIILAWRLYRDGGLGEFDPYPMVRRAAGYLVRHGPATPQERWEENGGYSPSTLASNIAALVCAALMARDRGDPGTADFLLAYADFLECHVEEWTVTERGTLHPDVPRHYVRILPADPNDPVPPRDPDDATIVLANRPPGTRYEWPASEIVDAGFLELVRHGIRPAGDPLIEDSLAVVDRVLRVDTPYGPAWHRYNHDGYGQAADGGPYLGHGVGRAWPLLTGERAHYELAAGRDVTPYVRAIEGFAHGVGLLPEQVWDEADRPDLLLWRGRPTGAAMPLMWAHAEYVKLLRSRHDGAIFDTVPEVADRYLGRAGCHPLEVWKPNRHVARVVRGRPLRVLAPEPFALRWRSGGESGETAATGTAVGAAYVDLPTGAGQAVTFAFLGAADGREFSVEIT